MMIDTSAVAAPSPMTNESPEINQFGPIRLVVIQPTSFCNLDCDYCYLPNRHQKNQLSLDLLEPIFKTIFTSAFLKQNFTICWHAGEPLAVPPSFYEAAFAKIEDLAKTYQPDHIQFNHSFQTNGLLINQTWCDLFQRYPVHVGVSIDGPAFLHDLHRKTRTGLGSHAGALRGVELLQKNEIPMSAIAVLTADSLDYPDEVFNFFLQHDITNVGFNMEEQEGINQTSSLVGSETELRYRAFLQRFWDLVAQVDDTFQLREFESICSLLYNDDYLHNTEMNHPFGIVSIDHQGNFATFDPELLSMPTHNQGNFVLGNVLRDTFESACQTEKFQTIYREMRAGVELCRNSCEYFRVCGGGAGSNKYWENGTFSSTETQACRYRIKAVTDVVVQRLEESLGLDT